MIKIMLARDIFDQDDTWNIINPDTSGNMPVCDVRERKHFEYEFGVITQRHGELFSKTVEKFFGLYGDDVMKLYGVYNMLLSFEKDPHRLDFIGGLAEGIGSNSLKFKAAHRLTKNEVTHVNRPDVYRIYFFLDVGKLEKILPFLMRRWRDPNIFIRIITLFKDNFEEMIHFTEAFFRYQSESKINDTLLLLATFNRQYPVQIREAFKKRLALEANDGEFSSQVRLLIKVKAAFENNDELIRSLLALFINKGVETIRYLDEHELLTADGAKTVVWLMDVLKVHKYDVFRVAVSFGKDLPETETERKALAGKIALVCRTLAVVSRDMERIFGMNLTGNCRIKLLDQCHSAARDEEMKFRNLTELMQPFVGLLPEREKEQEEFLETIESLAACPGIDMRGISTTLVALPPPARLKFLTVGSDLARESRPSFKVLIDLIGTFGDVIPAEMGAMEQFFEKAAKLSKSKIEDFKELKSIKFGAEKMEIFSMCDDLLAVTSCRALEVFVRYLRCRNVSSKGELEMVAGALVKIQQSPYADEVFHLKSLCNRWDYFMISAQLLEQLGPKVLVDYIQIVRDSTNNDLVPKNNRDHTAFLVEARDCYLRKSRQDCAEDESVDPKKYTCIRMARRGQEIDEKELDALAASNMDLPILLTLVKAGYNASEISKLPAWLIDSLEFVVKAKEKFPADGGNGAQAIWCANNAVYWPKNWQAKKLGNIILQRLRNGVDENLHQATHWLTQFEIPEEKANDPSDHGFHLPGHLLDENLENELMEPVWALNDSEVEASEVYYDNGQEKLLLIAAANVEKCLQGLPRKKQVYQSLFGKQENLEMYEGLMGKRDGNERKQIASGISLGQHEQTQLQEIRKNPRLISQVITRLKELSEKRKKYSEGAQNWVTNHGMTPSKDLVRAWKYRPDALKAGCEDNPVAINTWAKLNAIRLVLEKLMGAKMIPAFLSDNEKLKDFAMELTRCSSAKEAVKALERLHDEFNPVQKIPAQKIDLGDGWYGEIIPKQDVRGFTIGYDTGCCMTIGGASESCIYAGYGRPDCGFFTLYNGNRLMAQSFIWVNEKTNPDTIVLDNIEANKGRDRTKVIEKYRQFFKEYYDLLKVKNPEVPYNSVNLGMGYVEIDTNGLEKTTAITPPSDFYTDSKKQRKLL